MPRLVGAWLSGTFDADKAAARAAGEALLKVFKSEERVGGIWRVYAAVGIVGFARETVSTETVWTLSDERSTMREDAEGKYARVMGGCCLLVAGVVERMNSEEVEVEMEVEEGVNDFLREKMVWAFAFHDDSFLRRAVYRLLAAALRERRRGKWVGVNLEMIATAVVVKALGKSQVGSVVQLLQVLVELTLRFPEAWAVARPGKKKTALQGLVGFVKLGSQLAPPVYWELVAQLVGLLPQQVVGGETEGKALVQGVTEGIRCGPEPRTHLPAAWGCYWDVCYRLAKLRPEWVWVLKEEVAPVFVRYVNDDRSKERLVVTKGERLGAVICAGGLVKVHERFEDQEEQKRFLKEVWGVVEETVAQIVRSEHSDSKGSTTTKDSGDRWVLLVTEVLKRVPRDSIVYQTIWESGVALLSELTQKLVATDGMCSFSSLLKFSNDILGKATGSASFLQLLFSNLGAELLRDDNVHQLAAEFFEKFSSLIQPESVVDLLGAFISYGVVTHDVSSFQEGWRKVVNAVLLSTLPTEIKENSLQLLFNSASGAFGERVAPLAELDSYVLNKMKASLADPEAENAWVTVEGALGAHGELFLDW
jgi:hypothetical protein